MGRDFIWQGRATEKNLNIHNHIHSCAIIEEYDWNLKKKKKNEIFILEACTNETVIYNEFSKKFESSIDILETTFCKSLYTNH